MSALLPGIGAGQTVYFPAQAQMEQHFTPMIRNYAETQPFGERNKTVRVLGNEVAKYLHSGDDVLVSSNTVITPGTH